MLKTFYVPQHIAKLFEYFETYTAYICLPAANHFLAYHLLVVCYISLCVTVTCCLESFSFLLMRDYVIVTNRNVPSVFETDGQKLSNFELF